MKHWLKESEDELRALTEQGLSASQIGVRMGVTRNAVIGKWHRLRIPRPAGDPRDARDAPETPAAAPGSLPVPVLAASVRSRPPARLPLPVAPPARKPVERLPFAPPPLPEDFDLSGAALAFWRLSPCGCKWPEGNPASSDFRFCNEIRDAAAPYCAAHLAASVGSGTWRERAATSGLNRRPAQ